MWINLILMVISYVALALLSPKPKTEQQRPGTINDINFPHATDGSPLPILLGTIRQNGPNTLWYGDFVSTANVKKVKTGMFSSSKQVTGFSYYLGLQLGLGLGPGVTLVRMWLDKDIVWTGSAGPAETLLNINLPNLFGGIDSGGGWVGDMRFYGGEWSTQAVNAYLVSQAGGHDVPAYRGQAHIVFEHPYIGNSNSLKQIGVEVKCHPNTLGVGSGENIVGDDLNCAEALYYVLTDAWAGAEINPGDVDVASFTTASAMLYAEGNGLSLVVASANQAKDVISEILRQADGILYQDIETGKIVLKLIRADYDIATLPIFDETNIVSVKSFMRSSWSETMNETRVTFNDRGAAYAQGTALAQDMANINAQGRVRTQTLSFPGCCTADLAAKLAARELARLCVPIFRAQFVMNRTAIGLRPGDVFKFSWDDYNIVSAVMRVQKIDFGSLEDGSVIVDAIQDTFASSDVVFAAPSPTLTIPPSTTPSAIAAGLRTLQEIPYFLMQLQPVVTPPFAAASAWAMGFARQPDSGQQGYSVYVSATSGFADPSAEVNRIQYSDTALLKTAILATTGKSNGQCNVDVKLLNPSDFSLATMTTADARAGNSLFLIGNELFALTTVTDHGDGTYTLAARRALLDTEFAGHSVDAVIFFLTSSNGVCASTFGDAATIYAKFASFSTRGEYDVSGETPISLTFADRYDRPAPPDLLEFDGTTTPATVSVYMKTPPSTPWALTWRERNRTDTSISFEDDATGTPESSTTYRVEVWKDGVEYVDMRQTGVSGTTASLTFPQPFVSAAGGGEIRVYAEHGGLLSLTCSRMAAMTFSVPNP